MITTAQPPIDIHLTASRLLRTYGAEAVVVARRWAKVAHLAGETDRSHAWSNIVDLIKQHSARMQYR